MQKVNEKPKKKVYEKPKVVFQRRLETLATVCGADYLGAGGCQKVGQCSVAES